MKRLTSMILLISVFVCMVCTPLVVDAVSTSDVVENVRNQNFGSSIDATSVSQWGNYAFVTSGKSLKVLDLQTDSVVMTWDVRANLSAGSGNLIQSYITDDYIVCISNSDILVFENSMRVTDPLDFLMSIKPEGEDSFSQIKKFAVIEDTAYVFYHKDGEVFIAEFDADFENIEALDNVATIEGEDIHDIGYYEDIWDSVVIGDAVYFVSIDDNEIFTTLYAHKVDLDTFELTESEIISKKESSFCAEFVSAEEIDDTVLRDMRLYVNDTLLDSTIYDLYNSGAPIVNIVKRATEDEYIATVSLTELGESALTDAFGSLDNVSLYYYGEYYDFRLTEIDYDFDYSKGTIALYKSYLMAIPEDPLVHDGISTLYAYVIVNDSNQFRTMGRVMLNSMPPRNTMVRNFKIVGHELVLFYKDSNFIGVSQINPDRAMDIEYTFHKTYTSNTVAYLNATTFNDFVKIGKRLYYPANSSNALGYIETSKVEYYTDYAYDKDNNVLMVYGNTSSDLVTVTIDKKSYNVTPVGGAWRLNVSMLKAGSHKVKVTDGKKSKSFTFVTEEFDPPVELIFPIIDENGISVDVKNNTDLYSLNTTNINLYAVVYDDEERAVLSETSAVAVPFGETANVVFASITDDFLASYPGYTIKVYAYGQSRSPISNPYFVDNGFEMEDVVQTDLIGRASAVADVTVSVNPVTMKAEIKGVLEATAPRTAWVNISAGGATKDVAIGYCDEDGNFTAEYDFANEEIPSNGADFLFAVSAIGMNGQNAVSKRLFDADAFAEITEEILALDDASDLATILDDSTPVKTAYREGLGIDFADETYMSFDEDVKEDVLEEIIEDIESGKVTTETFDDVCFEKDDALNIDKAIELMNTVTANKMTQVLVKYHDVLGIADKVWKSYSKYTDSTKAIAINKEIIKFRDFEDGPDVENAVKKGVAAFLENTEEQKVGGGGGGGGGSILPPQEIAPVIPPIPVNPPIGNGSTDKGFKDLAGFEWAEDAINELQEKNIINGMDEEHFEPAGIVTRAQFVKMLVLAFGLDDSEAVTEFADVNDNDWFYPYVAAADQIGLTKGDGTNFYPNRTLTREEMAVLAYRALEISGIEIPEVNEGTEFADAETISEYATEGIAAMQKAGIINGMGDNLFAPKTMCNRAMAAKVISSLLGLE